MDAVGHTRIETNLRDGRATLGLGNRSEKYRLLPRVAALNLTNLKWLRLSVGSHTGLGMGELPDELDRGRTDGQS